MNSAIGYAERFASNLFILVTCLNKRGSQIEILHTFSIYSMVVEVEAVCVLNVPNKGLDIWNARFKKIFFQNITYVWNSFDIYFDFSH